MAGSQPIVGDIVEARIGLWAGNQMALNILHYLCSAATATSPNLLDWADALDNKIAPVYKPLMAAQATYRGVGCRNLTGIKTIEYISVTRAGPGTGGSGLMPTQVRGLITWNTTLAGPKYRGRSYIAFPAAGMMDGNGVPTSPYVANLVLLSQQIGSLLSVTSGANSATGRLVVYHRGSTSVPYTEVATINPRSKWATQRRSGSYGRVNPLPF